MTLGICTTCAHAGDVQQHHVAVRVHFPHLTIPVCVPCHLELHKRLDAHGVDLDHSGERSDVDRFRALLLGWTEVHRLHLEYHPNPMLPARVVSLLGRLISLELDRAHPRERTGRWVADPTIRIEEMVPTDAPSDAKDAMLFQHLQLAVDIVDSVEHTPAHDHPEIAALRLVAEAPFTFMADSERQLAIGNAGHELLADMATGVERIGRLLTFMATHDPDIEWPPEMLDEARLWGDTMRRLLEQLVDLAGLTEQVDR